MVVSYRQRPLPVTHFTQYCTCVKYNHGVNSDLKRSILQPERVKSSTEDQSMLHNLTNTRITHIEKLYEKNFFFYNNSLLNDTTILNIFVHII